MDTKNVRPSRLNRVDEHDLLEASKLALEIGSALTGFCYNQDLVLENTAPVAGFLLGGPDDDRADLSARCSAARKHLENLKVMQIRTGHLIATGDPEAFLAAVRDYYEYLMAHRAGQPDTDPRHEEMRKILAGAGHGFSVLSLHTRLAQREMEVTRQDLRDWLADDEQAGLIARTGAGSWRWCGPDGRA